MAETNAPIPRPVEVIAQRLSEVGINEKYVQTGFAIIGALEQSGWVIVRKRHARK